MWQFFLFSLCFIEIFMLNLHIRFMGRMRNGYCDDRNGLSVVKVLNFSQIRVYWSHFDILILFLEHLDVSVKPFYQFWHIEVLFGPVLTNWRLFCKILTHWGLFLDKFQILKPFSEQFWLIQALFLLILTNRERIEKLANFDILWFIWAI